MRACALNGAARKPFGRRAHEGEAFDRVRWPRRWWWCCATVTAVCVRGRGKRISLARKRSNYYPGRSLPMAAGRFSPSPPSSSEPRRRRRVNYEHLYKYIRGAERSKQTADPENDAVRQLENGGGGGDVLSFGSVKKFKGHLVRLTRIPPPRRPATRNGWPARRTARFGVFPVVEKKRGQAVVVFTRCSFLFRRLGDVI